MSGKALKRSDYTAATVSIVAGRIRPNRLEDDETRKLLSVMFLAMVWFAPAPAAAEDATTIAGVWRGPWYRGMTSGSMTLEVAPGGGGSVAFTNLETFGESPSRLVKTRVRGDVFEFSAAGEAGVTSPGK